MEKRHENMEERYDFFVDKFIEFHAILTPEQRKKLAEKIRKFKGKHGKR